MNRFTFFFSLYNKKEQRESPRLCPGPEYVARQPGERCCHCLGDSAETPVLGYSAVLVLLVKVLSLLGST